MMYDPHPTHKTYVHVDPTSYGLLALPQFFPTLQSLMLALQTDPGEAWDVREMPAGRRPVATLESTLSTRGTQAVRETLYAWWSAHRVAELAVEGVQRAWEQLVNFSPILGAWALLPTAENRSKQVGSITNPNVRRRVKKLRSDAIALATEAAFTGRIDASAAEYLQGLFRAETSADPVLINWTAAEQRDVSLLVAMLGLVHAQGTGGGTMSWPTYSWGRAVLPRYIEDKDSRRRATSFIASVKHQILAFPYSAWG